MHLIEAMLFNVFNWSCKCAFASVNVMQVEVDFDDDDDEEEAATAAPPPIMMMKKFNEF